MQKEAGIAMWGKKWTLQNVRVKRVKNFHAIIKKSIIENVNDSPTF